MKKIDFHIHTVPSVSDSYFDFDLNVLVNYVNELKLDAIAITNHNLFDRKQFELITATLSIDVFPGIEVDLEGGHILVISPLNKIDDFEQECKDLSNYIKSSTDSINLENFKLTFKNYKDYLLIPHYKKDPIIKESILQSLKEEIFVGEVGNPKKFEVVKKTSEALVPVLFSDERMREGLTNFNVRNTYVDIDNISISNLKIILKDSNKVFTNNDGSSDTFAILKDGTTASTKLNIVMGKRSSGKTYTLKSVHESFKEENVKFIEQFYITSNCNDENFSAMIERDNSSIIENYLSEIKNIIPDIISIDILKDNKSIDNYLSSLKENALNSSKNNAFSNAKIFSESNFNSVEGSELKTLIESVDNIIKNQKYKLIVSKYLDDKDLKRLFIDLLSNYKEEKIEYLLEQKTDVIINSVKSKLETKSAIPKIENINFYEVMKNDFIIHRFNEMINKLKLKSNINGLEKDIFRFKIKVDKSSFKTATEIQTCIGKKQPLAEIFKAYYETNPYAFLKKAIEQEVPENLLYKTLIKIDISIKNETMADISGGERAEFILSKELEDANKYDMIFIDEPEPSFDNLFLKENIIGKISEISKKTTTFISTHNNSVGISIKPDKIIYTRVKDGDYDVFTGTLTSGNLKSVKGEELSNFSAILDVMEAGPDAYKERGEIYENFKN
jgi:hypothetical protein